MLKCASRWNLAGGENNSSETRELVSKATSSANNLLFLVDPLREDKRFQDSYVVDHFEEPSPVRTSYLAKKDTGYSHIVVPSDQPAKQVDQSVFTSSQFCPFCRQFTKKVKCLNSRHSDGHDMKGTPGRDPPKKVHFQHTTLPAPEFKPGKGCYYSQGSMQMSRTQQSAGPKIVGGRSHRANFNRKGGPGMIKRHSVLDRGGRAGGRTTAGRASAGSSTSSGSIVKVNITQPCPW